MHWPLVVLAVLVAVFASPAAAQAPHNDKSEPEEWAWAVIQDDRPANLNSHCGRQLDPHNDAGWDDNCRQISAQFVINKLTDPKQRATIGRYGLRLIGARIVGDLDLHDADIGVEVWVYASRIDGNLTLSDAHFAHLLLLSGTQISGSVDANRLHADSSLIIRDGATFKGNVILRGAKIDGQLAMNGSTFEQSVDGDGLHVGQGLFMSDKATFKGDVILLGAKIDDQLEMSGSTFEQPVNGNGLHVGQSLFMRAGATFKATWTCAAPRSMASSI